MNLLDEIDRLRRELEYLSSQHRLDNSDMHRAYYEGLAEGERRATAAVVAWLRACAQDAPSGHEMEAVALAAAADTIERSFGGEHRREEEP